MLWICRAFDSRQNSGGNSGAFLPGFTGIYCGVLTGYSLGFVVLQVRDFIWQKDNKMGVS